MDLNFIEGQAGWIGQVFLVVLGVLLFDFAQRRVLNHLARRLEKTRNPWDDALLAAIRRPLSTLIWVVGLSFAADLTARQTEATVFQLVEPSRDVAVIVILAWFLVRFIRQVEANLIEIGQAKGEPVDRTTLDAVIKLLRLSVIITAALVILQTLGFSISGVLAFGGVGGIAVGFAARDLLANFFGGLIIYLDRPFSVGDWIRSPDRDIEGTVEKIGWRQTCIRTFDKRPLYVPNSVFATIAVQNPSRMSNRRIYETIGIRYADIGAMADIVAEVKAMLASHPEIDTEQTLMVNFVSFSASSIDFFIYTFTKTTVWAEFHAVKQDVLLKIADIIARHGAEIAFPTHTLHVPDGIDLRPEAAVRLEPT